MIHGVWVRVSFHFVLFPQLFDGFSQQFFLHFLYPFGCKDKNSFLNYIRTDVFLLGFSQLHPIDFFAFFIAFLNHVEDEAGRARLNLSSGHGR